MKARFVGVGELGQHYVETRGWTLTEEQVKKWLDDATPERMQLHCLTALVSQLMHTNELLFRLVSPATTDTTDPVAAGMLAVLTRSISVELTEFNFSVRASKMFKNMDIHTLADLLKYDAEALLWCENFGMGTLREIREKLAEKGLALAGETPEQIRG